jgi:hypothetical protein
MAPVFFVNDTLNSSQPQKKRSPTAGDLFFENPWDTGLSRARMFRCFRKNSSTIQRVVDDFANR